MSKEISINTKAIFKLSSALKDMHRSALPNVTRFTLNDLAFDVKKRTLKTSADSLFIQRTKTFFKANSAVEKAVGYDIKTMRSEVGMTDKNKASRNMKFHERGGNVPDRSFIAMKTARVSKSNNKKISKKNRLDKIDLINVKHTRGNKKQKLIRAAVRAKKTNKKLLQDDTLFEVQNVTKRGKKTKIKLKPLYSYKKGRKAKVSKSPFMKRAGMLTKPRAEAFFRVNYDRQLQKLKNKHKL